jgi:hypothetical protein
MKGQVLTIDFVTSMFILVSVMILVGFLWNTISTDLMGKNAFDKMMLQALSATELLVKTQGNPVNWNSSNVKTFGLAYSPNVLSLDKTLSFTSLISSNYSRVKEELGISEDYYFEVYDLVKSQVVVQAPAINLDSYDNVASISRLALLNGSEVRVVFALVR